MNKLEELEKQVELYVKNIESQQQSLETLKRELEQLKEEKENEPWKPKEGEWYWFISHGGRKQTTLWYGNEVGEIRYKLGNVFKTKEEAEFRAEQLKVESALRRFARPFIAYKHNFILTYNQLKDEIVIESSIYTHYTSLHFASEEIAQKAIDTVGEERIKKYYFGVNG